MKFELKDVTVDYSSQDAAGILRALDHLDLTISDGESVAIIGPSGCGKSTMLRLLTGLLAPTAGQVLANGEALSGPRQGTALILQDFGLLPWSDVYHNAELGLKIRRLPKTERERRTREALAKVGLAEFERAYPAELSGGMQQRLALARAIAMDVDALLMDEPLSALDALLREELQDTLLDLWQKGGYSQVLVTHSIEEAVFLGQRIVVMAPRPSRVVAIIDNPQMGKRSYRAEDSFFDRCKQVRAALAEGANGPVADSKKSSDGSMPIGSEYGSASTSDRKEDR